MSYQNGPDSTQVAVEATLGEALNQLFPGSPGTLEADPDQELDLGTDNGNGNSNGNGNDTGNGNGDGTPPDPGSQGLDGTDAELLGQLEAALDAADQALTDGDPVAYAGAAAAGRGDRARADRPDGRPGRVGRQPVDHRSLPRPAPATTTTAPATTTTSTGVGADHHHHPPLCLTLRVRAVGPRVRGCGDGLAVDQAPVAALRHLGPMPWPTSPPRGPRWRWWGGPTWASRRC